MISLFQTTFVDPLEGLLRELYHSINIKACRTAKSTQLMTYLAEKHPPIHPTTQVPHPFQYLVEDELGIPGTSET